MICQEVILVYTYFRKNSERQTLIVWIWKSIYSSKNWNYHSALVAEKWLNIFVSPTLSNTNQPTRRVFTYAHYTFHKWLTRGYLMYFEGEKMLKLKVHVTQNNLGIF
jgi:hypothetical protein